MSCEQIQAVLARSQPLLHADGLNLELIDIAEDVVTIRVAGVPTHCRAFELNFQTGLSEVLREEIGDFGELRLVIASPTSV